MLLHKGLGQSQPQARPPFAARHQRKEDSLLDRVRYTGPVVYDMQFQCQLVTLLANGDLTGNSGLQGQQGISLVDTWRQGRRSIVGNIEHGLNQLLAIAPKLGNGGVVIAHHTQALRKFGQDKRPHPLAHLVDVHIPHHMWAAMRCQQAVHQGL